MVELYRPIIDGSGEADIEILDFGDIIRSFDAWDTPPDVLGKKCVPGFF